MDHKKFEDKVKGPDVRVIDGAMVGPNLALSEIVSDVVEEVTNEADVDQLCSKSTEEILHEVEKYSKSIQVNGNGTNKRKVLTSMDIVKLYNNIEIDETEKSSNYVYN